MYLFHSHHQRSIPKYFLDRKMDCSILSVFYEMEGRLLEMWVNESRRTMCCVYGVQSDHDLTGRRGGKVHVAQTPHLHLISKPACPSGALHRCGVR